MTLLRSTYKFHVLSALAALGIGITAGCVIGPGDPMECGDTFSNSFVNEDGECECEPGYEWANPDDPDDFECDDADDGCGDVLEHNSWVDGECVCDPGYDWCDEGDTSDFSCCEIGGDGDGDGDGSGDGDGDGDGDGTGDGDGDGDGAGDGDGDGDGDGTPPEGDPPNDEDCTGETEGFLWCTHTEELGPWGSMTYVCVEGTWQEYPEWPDENCQSDGMDFGYGCIDNGVDVVSVCPDPEYPPEQAGPNSGADCDSNDGAAYCEGTEFIAYCLYDHTTSYSCQWFCENIGIDDVLYEFGECDTDSEAYCYCYDS